MELIKKIAPLKEYIIFFLGLCLCSCLASIIQLSTAVIKEPVLRLMSSNNDFLLYSKFKKKKFLK